MNMPKYGSIKYQPGAPVKINYAKSSCCISIIIICFWMQILF